MKKEGCKPDEIRMGGQCVPIYCEDCINLDPDPFGSSFDTHKDRFTGYIMPDGSIIDAGSDHYNISDCIPSEHRPHPDNDNLLPLIIKNFMKKCHAIRYSIDQLDNDEKRILVETYYKPTNKQIDTIVRDIRENRGIGFIGDRTNLHGEYCDDVTCSYDKRRNAHPWDIQGFIKKCWP